jgi:6-pyruvoyltetrahydropterin/6-carboxytetrahydropterin synthase
LHAGKCNQLHGHTYQLDIVIEGDVRFDGMVMDFAEIKMIVRERVLDLLDYGHLNERFENPTAEVICRWIWGQLENCLPLYSVKLWEGEGKWVEIVRE